MADLSTPARLSRIGYQVVNKIDSIPALWWRGSDGIDHVHMGGGGGGGARTPVFSIGICRRLCRPELVLHSGELIYELTEYSSTGVAHACRYRIRQGRERVFCIKDNVVPGFDIPISNRLFFGVFQLLQPERRNFPSRGYGLAHRPSASWKASCPGLGPRAH